MPLYEYRCAGCGHRFEVLQRVGQGSSGVLCPECGRDGVEKEYSTFAGSVQGGTAAAASAGCSPRGRFT